MLLALSISLFGLKRVLIFLEQVYLHNVLVAFRSKQRIKLVSLPSNFFLILALYKEKVYPITGICIFSLTIGEPYSLVELICCEREEICT